MKKLGIKISSTALFAMSVLFLITQSVWAGNHIVVTLWNGSAIASLIFAFLSVLTSGILVVNVFTKFTFGVRNRQFVMGLTVITVLFLVLSFAISIDHQNDARMVDGIKVFIPNVLFFITGMIAYIAGEVMINKDRMKKAFKG